MAPEWQVNDAAFRQAEFHLARKTRLAKERTPFLPSPRMNGDAAQQAQTISQAQQYVPVLLLFLVAAGFAFGTIALSIFVGNVLNKWRRKRLPIKDVAYECGMLPVGEGSTRLSVKFYLVAMLFILFDIEVVFLYPWAVVYKEMLRDAATRNLILFSMISFLAVLFIGYIYALKKRAFDWKR
jgi:NADH-quinone oxidoreductase subunit A